MRRRGASGPGKSRPKLLLPACRWMQKQPCSGAKGSVPVQKLLVCNTPSTAGGEAAVPPAAEPALLPASLVGRAVHITGEISCHQDLYVDGEVDGQMELTDHKLTIGPQAHVTANIRAQNVVIVGRAEGNIQATERVELCSQCSLVGEIETPRIVIKDGAHFKGTIHTTRPAPPMIAAETVATP
jgi:cytoskeletal protein CcmA (bactofilin family)